MNEARKAAFSFENYKVKSIQFKEYPGSDTVNISIGFFPSGKYYAKDKRFFLNLKFRAYTQENDIETEIISVETESVFLFTDVNNYDEIPDYFFRNSLGIVFPYLRAFVSTLTFQANINDPLILPILNLTSLETLFKESVEINS